MNVNSRSLRLLYRSWQGIWYKVNPGMVLVGHGQRELFRKLVIAGVVEGKEGRSRFDGAGHGTADEGIIARLAGDSHGS